MTITVKDTRSWCGQTTLTLICSHLVLSVLCHIHCVTWGTGTPKDKDEVKRREDCECDGWVCVCETIGTLSIFRVIRKAASLARMIPHFDLSWEENTTRWKWNCLRLDWTIWTPEAEKKRSVSQRAYRNKRRTNWLCNLPDVLATAGIKEIALRGLSL